MPKIVTFQSTLPLAFSWLNPPAEWRVSDGLHLTTDPRTDFWQRTHYDFRNDNGHALLTDLAGDFSLETDVSFDYATRYDQCGLFVRIDAENWIKLSTEYENPALCMLGSVVTNHGYSDWATTELAVVPPRMGYRISRSGRDFLLQASLDGRSWQQLRITHLHACGQRVAAGLYACSPQDGRFACTFHTLTLDDSQWAEA
jgi:regulation of enolase protein 1 (concanavalin A-like superfamily)